MIREHYRVASISSLTWYHCLRWLGKGGSDAIWSGLSWQAPYLLRLIVTVKALGLKHTRKAMIQKDIEAPSEEQGLLGTWRDLCWNYKKWMDLLSWPTGTSNHHHEYCGTSIHYLAESCFRMKLGYLWWWGCDFSVWFREGPWFWCMMCINGMQLPQCEKLCFNLKFGCAKLFVCLLPGCGKQRY